MADEEEDGLLNTLKFVHKIFRYITELVCSSLKPSSIISFDNGSYQGDVNFMFW
jgi:hypothetical protein